MAKFYSEDTQVPVSRLISGKYWAGNSTELVKKGTALSPDFTAVVFIPSSDDKTGVFDSVSGSWQEIDDRTQTPFFDESGNAFALDYPDLDFPEWAIFDEPPAFDPETQTVLWVESDTGGEWKIYEILIGTPYYDQLGNEKIVADFNFELPPDHTFTMPPDTGDDVDPPLATMWNGNSWDLVPDYRGLPVFNVDKDSEEYLHLVDYDQVGELPDNLTNIEQPDSTYIWDETIKNWVQDAALVEKQEFIDGHLWAVGVNTMLLRLMLSHNLDNFMSAEFKLNIFSDADYELLKQDRVNLWEYYRNGYRGDRPVLSSVLQNALDLMDQYDLIEPPFL